MNKSVLVVAGGTGGHISPGLGIAAELEKKQCQVAFLSLEKNRQYPDFANADREVHFYSAPKLPSRPWHLFAFLAGLIKSYRLVKRLAKKQPFDAVVGLGGYPTFPALLWARLNKIDYYLCEQNTVHGRITRLMAKKARKIFLSFPQKSYQPNEVVTGNPLRAIFKQSPPPSKGLKNVLMIGGSQGARDLIDLYEVIKDDQTFADKKFIIGAGKNQIERARAMARAQDEIFEFIVDMPAALTDADLVLSRAGAGLVFEILWARRPAVYFPYPHATGNHQRKNADIMVELGLAAVIDLRPFNADAAGNELKRIISEQAGKIKANAFAKLPFAENAGLAMAEQIVN